ncbi:MAG: bacillithiol biosynthesis cysteine-adding enzyme BshC [Thermoanaerobaculia bacterium]|nr:bacillithiol biosynthesis cysteine-adding enzyme BshC [Thermoanaerobaculia bacterium]
MAASLLPPLPTAFLEGRDLDLLRPLSFVTGPGDPAPASPGVDRGELAEALATANAGYGHPRAAQLAELLADPATEVVVTGQQPGLLGGPLYTLSKAVAAELWAQRRREQGRRAVSVFWVATEDHDFLEVARGLVLGPDAPVAFDLGEDPQPLMPVGMRTMGAPLTAALATFRDANPGDRWQAWSDRLAGWYRPDARFGEAFCRLLAGLLGDRCPLLLDSMLPALKRGQRPWLRRMVEKRREIERALAERDREIAGRGYDLQVTPQPGASPLFVIHGAERRRVEWLDDDRLALRGKEQSETDVAWLLETIEENPSVVSPGVLGRAPLQDAVLGSSTLVFGPGEVSYIPQVAPVYELLRIRPPAVFLRPQAMVLGAHQLDKLAALELGLADLLADDFDLDRFVARGGEEELVAPVRERFARELASLEEASLAIDKNLEGPWRKTRGQIERALDTFSGKVAAALARSNELERRRVRDLRDTCRPLGSLQERAVSVAHFPGKYGDGLVEAYFEQLELDPRRLQVVCPQW